MLCLLTVQYASTFVNSISLNARFVAIFSFLKNNTIVQKITFYFYFLFFVYFQVPGKFFEIIPVPRRVVAPLLCCCHQTTVLTRCILLLTILSQYLICGCLCKIMDGIRGVMFWSSLVTALAYYLITIQLLIFVNNPKVGAFLFQHVLYKFYCFTNTKSLDSCRSWRYSRTHVIREITRNET